MTQPAKAQEPSMEEILASIRRIIADDDAAKAPPSPPPEQPLAAAVPLRPTARPPAPPPPAPPSAPKPAPSESVLDEMLAELDATPAAAANSDDPAADVLDLTEAMTGGELAPEVRTIDGRSDIVFEDNPEPPPTARPQFPEPERPFPALMSRATSAAVDSAFNTLANAVLVQNARTLEDLVKEMLQPLLKTWLDDNLPGLVERLVRAEIERVSRGRT